MAGLCRQDEVVVQSRMAIPPFYAAERYPDGWYGFFLQGGIAQNAKKVKACPNWGTPEANLWGWQPPDDGVDLTLFYSLRKP